MKTTTWKDKFDEKFPNKLAEVIEDFESTIKSDLKDFIQSLLDRQKQNIITLIETEETDYPDRESDEFDEGGRMFKQALLSKLNKANLPHQK